VPVKPLPAPKKDNPDDVAFEEVQLLTAASAHPDTLQVFLHLGVSKDDQKDNRTAALACTVAMLVSLMLRL
jgi:hypothetical protein